jgi:hypothetical protein
VGGWVGGSETSQLTRPDAGHKDNWRKLYEKIDLHQRSSIRPFFFSYITWKELEKA